MPMGIGAERLLAEHRRAGDERPGDQRSEPAVFAASPTAPVAWRAISHLSLNYLSLVNAIAQQGAAALRDLLELYAHDDRRERAAADRGHPVGAASNRVVPRGCRMTRGPIAFGRGLEIAVDVDEMAFEGGSAFLLGAVLDRYFARYVSINSVTETVLRSQSRGEINRWTPNWGTRPTL